MTSISDVTFTERLFAHYKRKYKNEKKIKMKKITKPHLVAHLYFNKPPTTCQGFLANAKKPFFAGWRTQTSAPEAHGLFFGKR